MKILKVASLILLVFLIVLIVTLVYVKKAKKNWTVKSIDTMKYSRDMARQTLSGHTFRYSIDQQVTDIAKTGATHVAIGTPYDDEFLPVLNVWVKAARKNKLKVYFRGNFSGWEGWFGYKKIDRATHLAKTKQFIHNNPDLFQDGDIFSSCPECENGSKVNVYDKKTLKIYQTFLINEYKVTEDSFKSIKKKVIPNYFSMNMDVAHKVMDQQTTKQLGGIVVIDHYVKSPEILAKDVSYIAKKSGGKVVLGEFGAPIPSIHGKMSELEQKQWINSAFHQLSPMPELIGINYWVNVGGSTALWSDNGLPRQAVQTVKSYFTEVL